MIASLEEIDAVVAYKINDAVFLGQSPRPYTRGEIFEGFRFTDSFKGIPHNSFDQRNNTEGDFTIGSDPMFQVLDKLGLEDKVTLFPTQVLPRDAVCRES